MTVLEWMAINHLSFRTLRLNGYCVAIERPITQEDLVYLGSLGNVEIQTVKDVLRYYGGEYESIIKLCKF